jgi:hypothetical protein
MADIGRMLGLLGTLFLVLTLVFNLMPSLRRVPGDLYIRKGPFHVYIPFVSTLVLSIILTIIFNFFKK